MDLYDLKEREMVVSRNNLNQGRPVRAWATASVLAEVLLRGTQQGEAHPYLFRMLDKALTCLENGAPPSLLLLAFLVKFLEHAGYGLRLEETVDGRLFLRGWMSYSTPPREEFSFSKSILV